MPREPSAIMSISDKKSQAKDLKAQIKELKGFIKEHEKHIKTDMKNLAKLEAQLAVLSPKKVVPPSVSHGILRALPAPAEEET